MVWRWSKTAATNANADSTINWAEGMAPSAVNNSARAEMARVAQYRDDVAGAIVTTGTSTAYAVSSNQIFDTLAHMDGAMIAFTPHVTNGATVTLNVDGLGAKPLRPSPSVEIQSNALIVGTPYVALYSNTDSAWYLHGMGGNAYGIPLAAGMDYWAATTPSSAFAFPAGQAISRTTYSALFSLIGTAYGVGDGTTTFNLPDKTGRVSAMKESSASRLTSTYFGSNSTTLGAAGGGESQSLTQAQLPPVAFTFAGTFVTLVSSSSTSDFLRGQVNTSTFPFTGGGGSAGGLVQTGTLTANGVTSSVDYTPAGAVITSGGTNVLNGGGATAPHTIVQPTIICNYIMRVL